MAMSDLLFPIFVIPREMQNLYIDSWLIGGPLGQAFCKLAYFLTYVSIAVSTQSMVLIAVGRFGAVVYPLRSLLISSKLCPFFILTTWIVAVACLCPGLFSMKLVEYPEGLYCVFQRNEAFESYFLSLLVVGVFVPLVVIAILYILILLKLKSQRSPGEQSANAGQQRQQRERDVLKMAIAIVLGFAICWLPYAIDGLLYIFTSDIWSCGFQYFSTVAIFMVRANCAINPCICFIYSRSYREGLKTLLS